MAAETEAVPPLAFPVPPESRLRLSLRGLDAALEQQRHSIQQLRTNLAELQQAVGSVGEGLAAYRDVMADTVAAAGRAAAAARTLEHTADRMLAVPIADGAE